MTDSERVDYLIRVLSGNNARNFALKAGIRPDSLSRIRNGKGTPAYYFERILSAFPDVEREWLYTGDGEPIKNEKSEILARLDSLEMEVRSMRELLERIVK